MPALNLYYDPMARSRYTQLQFDNNIVVCDLVGVHGSNNLFDNQNGGDILPTVAGRTRLARGNHFVAGGLQRFNLQ